MDTKEVENAENVHRLIASPSCFEGEEISIEVFALIRDKENYISVNRASLITKEELIHIGKDIIKLWIDKNDTFCGWVTLNAGEIRNISKQIEVLAHSNGANPSHAGIHLYYMNGIEYVHRKNTAIPGEILMLQTLLRSIIIDKCILTV